jgi:hypothetical protein
MLRHRPFLDGPFRLAMGVRALETGGWIEPGADFPAQMLCRRQLLEARPEAVLAALPGSETAAAELKVKLVAHLLHYHAAAYVEQRGAVVERRTGTRLTLEGTAPLALVGRLVQEDFCLLQRRAGGYRLTAAVLCFPLHWSLQAKLGRPLIEIHEPVPGFAERLGPSVDRLFDGLRPERPVWRLNWSIVDRPDLFLPPAHRGTARPIDPEAAGEQLWLRVERRTLCRLPESGAVAFGIRTHVDPLKMAIDGPEAAAALLSRIEEMPAAMAAYKGIEAIRGPLKAYLRAQAGGSPPA